MKEGSGGDGMGSCDHIWSSQLFLAGRSESRKEALCPWTKRWNIAAPALKELSPEQPNAIIRSGDLVPSMFRGNTGASFRCEHRINDADQFVRPGLRQDQVTLTLRIPVFHF